MFLVLLFLRFLIRFNCVFVLFLFSLVLHWFWTVFVVFLLVFHRVLLCFGWSPFVFHCFLSFRISFERKTEGKLLENQSQPTPGPLRSFLLGLSILCHFSFTRNGEGIMQSGPLWTYSGSLLSLFLLPSLLWGSFSGTSPESLLVVWPPLGSSGYTIYTTMWSGPDIWDSFKYQSRTSHATLIQRVFLSGSRLTNLAAATITWYKNQWKNTDVWRFCGWPQKNY